MQMPLNMSAEDEEHIPCMHGEAIFLCDINSIICGMIKETNYKIYSNPTLVKHTIIPNVMR